MNKTEIEKQIVGPVVDQINERMDSFEQTLEKKVLSELDQKLEKLKAPKTDAAAFFGGGTPNDPQQTFSIRSGENVMTSRGFSYLRAAAKANGNIGPEDAKIEMAVARQLKNYYEAHQYTFSSRNAFLVPFGSELIPTEFENAGGKGTDSLTVGDLGVMMAQTVKGTSEAALKKINQKFASKMDQTLSVFDDTALGIFTQENLGEIIELVRAAEVLGRIGAREITLAPNGHLTLPKQTGAASAGWIGETGTISTSEPQTGKVELRAKKAAGLVQLPNELLRYSTRDTESFLRADLALVLSTLVDQAFFLGVGSTTQPLGVLNRSGITTKIAGTVGANGDTLEPNDVGGMLAAVEELDHDVDSRGFAFIMRGKMWRNLVNRRTDAVTADDEAGAYLFSVNRNDISQGIPGMLEGWPVVRSGNVSNSQVKGSGTDLTFILAGIPDDILVGRVGVLEFAMASEATIGGTNLFETDQSAIRVIENVDIGMRNENSWVVIDSLDMDLPVGAI